MNKQELMMKAVVKFKGEWPIFGWGSLPPEKRVLGISLISDIGIDKGGIYCIDRRCDATWSVLCTHDEFYQFIDELLETCIKWDEGMSKDKLMIKAVIEFKGEMFHGFDVLVHATDKGIDIIEDVSTDTELDILAFVENSDKWDWLCTRDEFDKFIDELLETCIKWDKPKWDGEGLPPVGVECEYFHQNLWIEVRIKYIGSKWIWFQAKGEPELARKFHFAEFRPIKTEKEKERERLIELASKVITRKTGSYLSVGQKELIEELFDAGLINAPSTKAD